MKKTLLLLTVLLVILASYIPSAYADAIAYDMTPSDYFVYVTTPDGGLNMRYGPGTEYEKVMPGRIPDGVKLYISYESGTWGYTSYDGYSGWVALKQTSPNPPASPSPSAPIETPQVTSSPSPENSASPAENSAAEAENMQNAKNAMSTQLLLIVILLLIMVIIALITVIIINLKSRK